ncbi:MAG: glycosyl hydrolase [Gammaproteobacteria bacterium]|nr:glycosyl hydrolase [Gammaproteobacteria bacterium]MDH4255478.1 glycosyl hydrolase [Gammaproteobacteria bacterium]MDH5309507.1 glycosyl hydrolase [Gammaproteobacteria bacterium]
MNKQTYPGKRAFVALGVLITMLGAGGPAAADEVVDPDTLSAVEWRLVGPYRGGRVTTVTGVADNAQLYYMGATGGGVWKTENAGTTWENISDGHIDVGTIGAVAVAESDHNVIYVGTGESPIRGVTTSQGKGVYRSTDAGKTWTHIGLDRAGQIARIQVHPADPDVAYIAAQGQIWGPNAERGIFRTTDGGKSWQHVLKVSDTTGASDLSMDPTNPRILYAAMWNHGRKPWFIHSGGTDGGIFKTTDGGDTWTRLEGGLPEMVGKIGVDVSASMPERVYALIEAEPEKGGLWRSDDAGKTWKLINGHRVLHTRAWYYIHVTADPVDPDTVWVLNVPLMKSIDAGATWQKIDTPHGDHHDHWINPRDNRIMINGNDGGATVTFDGGKTWSSIHNQPTAQFYRVVADNDFPYRIYGGQQDNSTVAIATSSFRGGIGEADYFAVGGGESAHIAFDPDDPRLVYATTINGTLTEYDRDTQVTRVIIPYPEMVYGKDSRDLKYRANWNAPVAVSPHDPSIIYFGTQMLLKSTDRGTTWTEISPDLTRNDPEKQGRNGGPLTPENVGAEFYNTIFYIVESAAEAGTIWVGSDDGLIHVTRNAGESWDNVSPPHRGEAMINALELSPHDPATAYAAVTGYKLNDFRPYIYKTTDYGRRWRRIDAGLPEDAFVRVVREDPARRGLLYAGTETGAFVSFNDGADWQPLQLNLPRVPVTDLRVQHDNLIAATQGRAFWVLDDLFVLRQAAAETGSKALHLYSPGEVPMVRMSSGGGNFEGKNPSSEVPLYYYLREEETEAPLTIEIRDANGRLVRSYTTEESDHDRCRIANMDPRRPFEIKYPARKAGLNRWGWDMRSESIRCIPDIALFAGFGGPTVAPGRYEARIVTGDRSASASFTLTPDPRGAASDTQRAEWVARLAEISGMLSEILGALQDVRTARSQVEALLAEFPGDAALGAAAAPAIAAIGEWEALIDQPKHETYEDEDAWETMLAGQLRYLMDVIDRSGAPVTDGAMTRLADLRAQWALRRGELRAISADLLAPINDWARQKGVDHVWLPEAVR